MNKQELENKINELEKQLTELKEELNKPVSKVWKPKYGGTYYYIHSFSGACDRIWGDTDFDENLWAIGNCFKTKEEAEFEVERLKVIAELKRFAEEHNEPIDWGDRRTVYYIAYEYLKKKVCIYFTNEGKSNDIYFSTEELAQQAIKEIGEDRVKKYYLGVNYDKNK